MVDDQLIQLHSQRGWFTGNPLSRSEAYRSITDAQPWYPTDHYLQETRPRTPVDHPRYIQP